MYGIGITPAKSTIFSTRFSWSFWALEGKACELIPVRLFELLIRVFVRHGHLNANSHTLCSRDGSYGVGVLYVASYLSRI